MADVATIKKYLDQAGLETLVGKIKALDAATLEASKGYADGLATNYDEAGAASTAEANAKSYADEKVTALADGQVKKNTDAIAAIVADYLKAADKKELKDAIDALKTFVGTLPESTTAKSIVAYIDEKTAGIAKDSDLQALITRVDAAEADIDVIQADYLKAKDKTELSGAISAEKTRAEGVEAGLRTDVDAIKGDYLKASDKTTLEASIKTAQDTADAIGAKVTTLVGSDADKSVRTIANEELAAQLIPEGAKESLDTLQEIAAWIQAHPDDASAMNQAITALETLVGTIPEGVTATTIVAYIQEVVAAEKARAEEAESGIKTRLQDVETKLGEGSVASQIATAKQEAIDTAAADATSKANQALADAKSYADTEDAKIEARVDDLEADTHTHANKTLLDTYDQTNENIKDAVVKKHAHANAEVLDGISAEDVAAWNSAEANAKAHANNLNQAMSDRVGELEGDVAANTEAIGTKAAASDLTALAERVTTAETSIAANTSAINSFVRISESEIEAMFA